MHTPPPTSKSIFARFAGRLLLGIGAGTAGGFLVRQLKESEAGHTYYEFIALGLVVAVIGFIILRGQRKQPQV